MPSIYKCCATIVKVVEYDDNGKPITRILKWSTVTGLITVIFIDSMTCAIILYWLISTIYMPIIRTYLAIVFTDMGVVASFTEMFVVGFTVTTFVFTAVLLRDLTPVYGPGGNPYANILTLIESAWSWISSAN